jgi:hypothetical protein
VEKVLKPPQNPIISAERTHFESKFSIERIPIIHTRIAQLNALLINVPTGNVP